MEVSFIPIDDSFKERRTIRNFEAPVKIGRHVESGEPAKDKLRFVSKVVSRQHAVLFFADGKVYIQDTKSSSGTFLNGRRLSPQGEQSENYELKEGDLIQLGEDCEVNGTIHKRVGMRMSLGSCALDHHRPGNINERSEELKQKPKPERLAQPMLPRYTVRSRPDLNEEFARIWGYLTQDIQDPIYLLKSVNPKRTSSLSPQPISPPKSALSMSSVSLNTTTRQMQPSGQIPSPGGKFSIHGSKSPFTHHTIEESQTSNRFRTHGQPTHSARSRTASPNSADSSAFQPRVGTDFSITPHPPPPNVSASDSPRLSDHKIHSE
ncbi:hypothetical protein BJ742DRAFT_811173 [Cladochytrium replicatum]|nr:hypothetical protein BJ742DRAFT_811173 [Cladochytrium replicatum]